MTSLTVSDVIGGLIIYDSGILSLIFRIFPLSSSAYAEYFFEAVTVHIISVLLIYCLLIFSYWFFRTGPWPNHDSNGQILVVSTCSFPSLSIAVESRVHFWKKTATYLTRTSVLSKMSVNWVGEGILKQTKGGFAMLRN